MFQSTVLDGQQLRLDGVYPMNSTGDLMLRVKIPAGVLSAEQALVIAELAERFAGGCLHLTCRGSMELHRLRHEQLAEVARALARVGLTSRGACGGAVRGVSCSTSASPGFDRVQALARRLHRHFTGNPHFEGLPKKFKIAVEADAGHGRQLIQDVGLVLRDGGGAPRYDIWLAGGLGREPRPAFLYRSDVPEGEVIPLIEAVIRAYRAHAPAPRRLKYLAAVHGEEGLRQLIDRECSGFPSVVPPLGIEGSLTPSPAVDLVEVAVFAGELAAGELRQLAQIAEEQGDGFLLVTADQNIAFVPADDSSRARLQSALRAAGLIAGDCMPAPVFRICPGSHICRIGLAPTRDVARRICAAIGPGGRNLSWAISGCANSCSQPQLADVGILTARFTSSAEGGKEPLFTLLRRTGPGLGTTVAEGLSLEELLERIAVLS